MSVCGRFKERLDDFKRYGLVNIGHRKILLNLILSNDVILDIESGWHENIEINVIQNECEDYVSNTYRFYAELNPENIRYKWLVRLDDDSTTDIDGLVSNLEEFYDHRENFYLGTSLQNFGLSLQGREGSAYHIYSHVLGNYERISRILKTEIEFSVVSSSALKKILTNEHSLKLIRSRARVHGGHLDCVMALASAVAKLYPVEFPFSSHLPLLENFSLVGGTLNHIHMISRKREGENFQWERASAEQFLLLTKIVDGNLTEIETALLGSKFLLDTREALTTYEFKENYILKSRTEDYPFMWMENDGFIFVLNGNTILHKFSLNDAGNLTDGKLVLKRI